jgi:hypothetical protein
MDVTQGVIILIILLVIYYVYKTKYQSNQEIKSMDGEMAIGSANGKSKILKGMHLDVGDSIINGDFKMEQRDNGDLYIFKEDRNSALWSNNASKRISGDDVNFKTIFEGPILATYGFNSDATRKTMLWHMEIPEWVDAITVSSTGPIFLAKTSSN